MGEQQVALTCATRICTVKPLGLHHYSSSQYVRVALDGWCGNGGYTSAEACRKMGDPAREFVQPAWSIDVVAVVRHDIKC